MGRSQREARRARAPARTDPLASFQSVSVRSGRPVIDVCGSGTGIRTPVPWLRNGSKTSAVLGFVVFVRKTDRIVGPSRLGTALFVRKVSSFFQVVNRPVGDAVLGALGRLPRRPGRQIDRTR